MTNLNLKKSKSKMMDIRSRSRNRKPLLNLICAALPSCQGLTGVDRVAKKGGGRGCELTIKIPSKLTGRDQLVQYIEWHTC